MRRTSTSAGRARGTLRYLLAALVASGIPGLAAQSPTPEFDVASIKRNTSDTFVPIRTNPNVSKGEIRLVRVPARLLVLRAFPLELSPPQILGLPGWADSEYFDVSAKGPSEVSGDDVQQMWRTLLADRMQLAAHYEMRERPTYDLVFAQSDRSLGAGLKPSTLDCSTQDTSARPRDLASMKAFVMSRCGASFTDPADSTFYAGALQFSDLVESLRLLAVLSEADRPIIDKTGLSGAFQVTLRARRGSRLPTIVSPDDPPSIFTALPEQLGLKLQPSTTRIQVLVIDRVERPSEN
jgi:bla regulator protein blaR1